MLLWKKIGFASKPYRLFLLFFRLFHQCLNVDEKRADMLLSLSLFGFMSFQPFDLISSTNRFHSLKEIP